MSIRLAAERHSLETAVEHAKGCPIYSSGGRVEVRPMLEI